MLHNQEYLQNISKLPLLDCSKLNLRFTKHIDC